MKRLLFSLTILLGALVLAACSSVHAGTIVNKEYRAAYTTWYNVCVSYDTKGMCRQWMPMTDNHPETWNLLLQNRDGDKGWVRVSHDTYESVTIGEFYDAEG